MNLILIPEPVNRAIWGKSDPRFLHISNILKSAEGSVLDFAVENGPRGKGKIESINRDEIKISFLWNEPHESDFLPLRLVVGLSRPQTCRKILEQSATMGIEELHFFAADKGEDSYLSSSLWTTDEWKEKIKNGVAQAFSSHIPTCRVHQDLKSILLEMSGIAGFRVGLDNYEAKARLAPLALKANDKVWVAIGPERGWSADERNLLREHKFNLRHLGERVLRVETAVVATVGILGMTNQNLD